MPVYIVTGDGPRCGSSMIMQGLKAGGMPVSYSAVEDRRGEIIAEDYDASPGGRYEISPEAIDPYSFPTEYEGGAIKAFVWPWTVFCWRFFCYAPFGEKFPVAPNPLYPYQICWMHRPYAPRWASFHKANVNTYFVDAPNCEAVQRFRDACAQVVLDLLRSEPTSLTELDFDEVIEDPSAAFTRLGERGWPINPKKAAAVVDPSLRRFT